MTHDKTETVNLSREQLSILNEAERVDRPSIVSGALYDALVRIGEDGRRDLADATTPMVVDAANTDPDVLNELLAALETVDGDPCVVDRADAEAFDDARAALSTALFVTGRVSEKTARAMPLSAIVQEFADLEDPRSSPAVLALANQHPETSSPMAEDEIDPDPDPLDRLTLADRDDIRRRIDTCRKLESRIPARVSEMRDELAEEYGAPFDDLAEAAGVTDR